MMFQEVYCRGCGTFGPLKEDEHTHDDCQCNGQEIRNERGWRESLPYPEERIFPANCVDEKGFILCKWCGLPCIKNQLVKCETCGRYFKGPRPYFPIDFDCENCG